MGGARNGVVAGTGKAGNRLPETKREATRGRELRLDLGVATCNLRTGRGSEHNWLRARSKRAGY